MPAERVRLSRHADIAKEHSERKLDLALYATVLMKVSANGDLRIKLRRPPRELPVISFVAEALPRPPKDEPDPTLVRHLHDLYVEDDPQGHKVTRSKGARQPEVLNSAMPRAMV
jgi:hypothetical protein